MSHTTSIKGLKITDSYAIAAAVDALKAKGVKCHLATNQKPRMYYPDQEKACPYVLVLEDGKYDVGFRQEQDGSYTPVFDLWGQHISSKLANKACKLPKSEEERAQHAIGLFLQSYTKAATVNAATSQGMMLVEEREDAETGELALVFE